MALVVALVILVVLTSMGLSGLRTANLQEHFSGNARDRNLAFEAAESALRYSEDWLQDQAVKPYAVNSCGGPPCNVWLAYSLSDGYFAAKSPDWWNGENGEAQNGRLYLPPTGSADLARITNQPRFIIEYLGAEKRGASATIGSGGATGSSHGEFYRITAFGQGGSKYSNVVLQTTYSKRFN